MLQADNHNSAASAIIRFSDGDARHSEGEAGTIIPEACRVAAFITTHKVDSSGENTGQELLGVKLERWQHVCPPPTGETPPHGHGTGKKGWGTRWSCIPECLGSRAEWIWGEVTRMHHQSQNYLTGCQLEGE